MDKRYSRQVAYIGQQAQDNIGKSKVCIVGCGALGSSSAELLARAGAGTIKLVDRDFIEMSNLQRQRLFDEGDIDKPKALQLAGKLKKINSSVKIGHEIADFNSKNAESMVKGFDIVIDGLDNMHSRFILNEACVRLGIRWVYGAAIRNTGYVSFIDTERNCLNCFIKNLPAQAETCETSGVTNSIASLVSAVQANEALKYLENRKYTLFRRLLYIDLERVTIKSFTVKKDPNCRVCSLKKFDFLDGDGTPGIISLCGNNAYHLSPPSEIRLDMQGAKERLPKEFLVTAENEFLIRASAGSKEVTIFSDGRMMTRNMAKGGAETVFKRVVLM